MLYRIRCTGCQVLWADKMDTMRNYVFNGAVLTGGIGVTVTVLCSVFCPQILHLLSVPEDIFRGAYHYLLIIFLGIPFTLLYNYLSSILRSLGDSRTPFLFLAFSAILNIFLDLFCIVVLNGDVRELPLRQLQHRRSVAYCVLFLLEER
mgnify:CR=1 FL=1